MTFGRTLGESWPGYLFIENINTKNFKNRISLNITPKTAWTSTGNPLAIGSSLIFELNDSYSIILERNNALRNSESNFTTAIRISNDNTRYYDFYLSDAASFNDIGEFINADELSYGIKLGIKF